MVSRLAPQPTNAPGEHSVDIHVHTDGAQLGRGKRLEANGETQGQCHGPDLPMDCPRLGLAMRL